MAVQVDAAVPQELLAAPIPEGPAHVVDARGLLCPQPIVRLSQAIRRHPSQQLFLLESTDAGTVPDLIRWVRPWGHSVASARIAGDSQLPLYRFWVRPHLP